MAAAPCIYTAVKVSEGESGSLNQPFINIPTNSVYQIFDDFAITSFLYS